MSLQCFVKRSVHARVRYRRHVSLNVIIICPIAIAYSMGHIIQDAQLSQRDRAAGCVIVFAKSRTLELGDNDLRTL